MLSRGNTNAYNRLRRAKSSSFTQTAHYTVVEPKTIDPAIARQHAIAAASHAFERSNEQSSVIQEIKQQWHTLAPSPGAENALPLARKQSVRFTGPNAVQTRDIQITRRVVLNDPANHASHGDETRLSQGSNEYDTCQSENYIGEMATIQDSGPPVPLMPSSYRKLRKAKSMLDPRNHRPVIFANAAPKKESHLNQLLPTPRPHLRRSFSFIRGGADNNSANADQSTIPDTAVQMARDQFLHQFEHERSKDHPSYGALSKDQKPQKAFRKTVRTSSTNSYGSPVASVTPSSAEPIAKRRFGHKARSLSLSLKNKLKRVFRRPSDTEESLPLQQVNRSGSYAEESLYTSSGVDQQYHPIPSPDEEIVKKAMSRESMFRNVPELLDKPSHPGSIRSVRSDDDMSTTKSRVTSWTNSTAANTMTSNQLIEKKRLSIIEENGGPYQPSSSIRHYGDLGNLFHQPVRINSVDMRAGNVVDSKIIYDALQRRIDESKRAAQSDESEAATENEAENTRTLPSSNGGVPLNSRMMTDNSTDSLAQRRGIGLWNSTNVRPSTAIPVGDGLYQAKEDLLGQIQQQNGLTPQQIAERNESGIPSAKRPLREVRSTFFPSSTRIERSSTSPYRRLMNSSSEDDNGTDLEGEVIGNAESVDSPLGRISPNSAHVRSTVGTESVYSRGSSGETPKPDKSSLSLATSARSAEARTAVIITTRARQCEQSLSPLVRRSISSVRSSEDRQRWMASQVAPLETQDEENRRVSNTKLYKENGHKRENAQIIGDARIGKFKAFIESPKQPLGIIQENAISRPVLRHEKSHPMNDRFPLLEIGQPGQSNISEQSPSTPIRRWPEADHQKCSPGRRNKASTDPTDPSLKGSSTSRKSPISSPTFRRGQLTTDSENMEIHTPDGSHPPYSRLRGLPPELKHMDKTQSRNSPERIARLRRMQSKSSRSLGSEVTPKRELELGLNRFHLQERKQNVTSPSTTAKGNSDNVSSSDDMVAAGMSGPVEVQSAGGGRKLVDIFLSTRRRQMTISDEGTNDGAGPAYL